MENLRLQGVGRFCFIGQRIDTGAFGLNLALVVDCFGKKLHARNGCETHADQNQASTF